jgi:signal transduction histidine kinase
MFRSTSLRLAALYTALFAAAVVVLGVATFFSTRSALRAQVDARIHTEAIALDREFTTEGLDGVLRAVRERDVTPGALDYGLSGPRGVPLAGRLANVRTPPGWSELATAGAGAKADPLRIYTLELGDGYRLIVGEELERAEALDGILIRGFAWTFLGVLVLGMLGGYGLSRDMHRRLSAISSTAEAIIDGDLRRRVPVRRSDDDLDRMAVTINRMLDRIGDLMDSVRQVSNDIAHDLRTPMTRLRNRLEAGLTGAEPPGAVMEAALQDLDGILDTFTALLRIAQVEGSARRAGFRPLDLAAVCHTVVEAFAPAAEDAGQTVTLAAPAPVTIVGDAELLTQMLVNLVENALRHTPEGSHIRVSADARGATAVLTVVDDGPGIPEAERERVFDRFYRLERSRSTAGSGLGLAMAAAVARLHRAQIELGDAGPGLEVEVAFPSGPA